MIHYIMKILADMPHDRPISVNRTFFYITMIFMSLGLAEGLSYDLSHGFVLLFILDVLVFLFFIFCFFMVHKMRVEPALVMLACTILTLILYYVSFNVVWSFTPGDTSIWRDVAINLLLTGVLGAASGLIFSRRGTWYFVVLGAGFIASLYFRPEIGPGFGRVAFMGIIILCMLMVVYYFRSKLERLVAESSDLIRATRTIKDKLERQNEEDRPFVYFGQNSVGLVMDFRTDVDRMQEHIKVLELGDCGQDEQITILQHMEEQARSLSRRIDLVTFITSAGPERPPELLKIRQVFEAALYPFRISPELAAWLKVDVETPADLDTFDHRFSWLRLIEFIMRQTLRPDLKAEAPLHITFLITGTRDQIRMAYQESRPVLFAQPELSVRSRFHTPSMDVLKTILADLDGVIESQEPAAAHLVLLVPRRQKA